jgi:hypothetical protein
MKNLRWIFLVSAAFLAVSCANQPEGEVKDTTEAVEHDHSATTSSDSSLSPRKAAMANIGDVHVHIDYSSPSVRGRIIWGGLVAYDQVWVTGAHSATSVDFSKDVLVNGQEVPAGKYAFFTVPGKEKWTVILNKNYEQHLADDYDPEDDVLRFEVVPTALDTQVESLTYQVLPSVGGDGAITLSWDKIAVVIPIEEVS